MFLPITNKLPNKYQWSHFFKAQNQKERYIFWFFVVIFIFSNLAFLTQWYLNKTEVKPVFGGKYTEGIIGAPRFLNPVLSSANDADRDLSQLIFSSLLKYDNRGNLMLDIAESYSISSDGKIYDVILKKNIKWQDKTPLSADDVLFTIGLIQNLDYKSPLRINWIGITAEKIDDYHMRFSLNTSFSPFPHNLTFGILPKHIWKNVSAANFSLNPHNLNPISSGPYKLQKITKDKNAAIKSLTLEINKNYYSTKPFIKNITFKFYNDENSLFDAYNKNEIDSFGFSQSKNISKIKYPNLVRIYSFTLPRYFAIFFNSDSNRALADKNVRIALNYATDKKSLIDKVLNGYGTIADSPIPPQLFGYDKNAPKYEFDLGKAKAALDKSGWKDTNQDGIREKEFAIDKKTTEIVKLEITLITTPRQELTDVANLIKEQWSAIGVEVNIETKESLELQQNYIKPRRYDALLFGEVLGMDPDALAFWDSTQKKDPGLNLSLFDNKNVDTLLKEAREITDPIIRSQKYALFQSLVIADAPVVFLYSPFYFYAVSKNIKGVEEALIATPTGRFNQITNWYVKTKRVWK